MTNTLIKISVVVPVYNSAATLYELHSRILKAMESASLSYELILVDDHSSDDSWGVISKICESDQCVTGLHLSQNSGQWCASLIGMSRAAGKYIVTIDDDLEYDPIDILRLYKTITGSTYAVVFGIASDKYDLQGKNRELSKVRNAFLNFFWAKPLTDSFKILDKNLLYGNDGFLLNEPFETFIAHHLGHNFWGYTPVRFNKRRAGESSHSFNKKVKLLFVFSSYFSTYPEYKFFVFSLLSFFLVFTYCFIPHENHITLFLKCLNGFVIAISIYYLIIIYTKAKYRPRHSIDSVLAHRSK